MAEQLTKKNLVFLSNNWSKLEALRGGKLVYALGRSKRRIDTVVDALNDIIEQTKEFKEYNKQKIDLMKRFADRDEKGQPMFVSIPGQQGQGNYIITKNLTDYRAELTELDKKFKKALDERDKQWEDYREVLREPVEKDFKLFDIKVEFFEEDTLEMINEGQMELLVYMISSSDKEVMKFFDDIDKAKKAREEADKKKE